MSLSFGWTLTSPFEGELITFRGGFSRSDIRRLRLSATDNAILQVASGPDATDADVLLAITLIFQRNSEQQINPNQYINEESQNG